MAQVSAGQTRLTLPQPSDAGIFFVMLYFTPLDALTIGDSRWTTQLVFSNVPCTEPIVFLFGEDCAPHRYVNKSSHVWRKKRKSFVISSVVDPRSYATFSWAWTSATRSPRLIRVLLITPAARFIPINFWGGRSLSLGNKKNNKKATEISFRFLFTGIYGAIWFILPLQKCIPEFLKHFHLEWPFRTFPQACFRHII